MAKVEGSSPFIRFSTDLRSARPRRVQRARRGGLRTRARDPRTCGEQRRVRTCVVVGLLVALLPWLSDEQSAFVAASSLAALCYSFALDVRDLARRRTMEGFTR